MDTGRLNVLHDANDVNILAITDCIRFRLNGAFQEVIEQNLIVGHIVEDVHHMLLEFRFIDNDLHFLPTQNIAWTNQ